MGALKLNTADASAFLLLHWLKPCNAPPRGAAPGRAPNTPPSCKSALPRAPRSLGVNPGDDREIFSAMRQMQVGPAGRRGPEWGRFLGGGPAAAMSAHAGFHRASAWPGAALLLQPAGGAVFDTRKDVAPAVQTARTPQPKRPAQAEEQQAAARAATRRVPVMAAARRAAAAAGLRDPKVQRPLARGAAKRRADHALFQPRRLS